jgi:hypothetical protein
MADWVRPPTWRHSCTASKAFAALPRHVRSRQDTLTSSHRGAATAAIPAINAWLDQAWR